jgi:hypothetical protein
VSRTFGYCLAKEVVSVGVQGIVLVSLNVRVSFLRVMRYIVIRGNIGVRVVGNITKVRKKVSRKANHPTPAVKQ